MTNDAPGPGWWQAADGNWYPPSDAPAPPTWAPSNPPYGAPPYGGAPYGPPRRTNSNATISLVLGIISLAFSCGCLTGIPAIIFGRMAKREIEASDPPEQGGTLATVGVVLGIISTVLSVIGIAFFTAVILLVANSEPTDIDDFQAPPTISVPR